jgi:probable addiction module antidote protein
MSDKEVDQETETAAFDVAELLDSPEMIAEYLTQALAENDSAYFLQALGNVARARGMTDLAKTSGVSRSALYRALSSSGRTEFDTVQRVAHAMGLRLQVGVGP